MPTVRQFGFLRGPESYLWDAALQVPGCVARYRSDSGITLNGSTVRSWADSSGNGNVATQATTSAQPTYNAVDAAYAGQPSLSFLYTSHQILVAALSLAQPDTIFIVGNTVTAAGNAPEFVDGTTVIRHFVGPSIGLATCGMYAGVGPITGGNVTSPSAIIAQFNGATSALYLNNSATPSASGNAGTNALVQLTIGGGVPNGYLNGKITEIAVYNRIITQPERAFLMAYAAARYGISAS